MKLKYIFLIAGFLIAPASVFAAPGDLDPTFNSTGKLKTTQVISLNSRERIEILSDGKILVSTDINPGTGLQAGVLRFNANGSLDTTFGEGGVAIVGQNVIAHVYGMTLQPDGKILLTGGGFSTRCVTLRLKADGTNDTTFNGTGKVESGPISCFARAIQVQDNGKIVVGGYANSFSQSQAFTAMLTIRYNSDGTPDAGYGSSGVAITPAEIHHYADGVYLAVQPDGKIVQSVTRLYQDANMDGDVGLIRYNANGTLDSSFGGGGFAVSVTPDDHESVAAMSLTPDGKILVASANSGGGDLTRFNGDGSVDSSFGSAGVIANPGASVSQTGALRIRSDGKFLVGGSVPANGFPTFAVSLYNADGTLDTSAPISISGEKGGLGGKGSVLGPLWGSGNSGTVTIGFDGFASQVHAMNFDAVGRVVVSGRVYDPIVGGNQYLGLARLQSDAPLYANVYGAIRTAGGMPIKNVTVVLSEGDLAQPKYALTNQFGLYFFSDLPVTENYSVSISSKRFSFSTGQQHVMLLHDTDNIDFTAEP